MIDISGKIFNIQRFSLDDGDGIRTCVFLKGCPLKCKWCHNAESQAYNTEIAYYPQNCILCGACTLICDKHIISQEHIFDRNGCLLCARCTEVCSSKALEAVGKAISVEDAVKEVLRDAPFFGDNGGVTITGGEPMSQFDFSYALAKRIKEEGYTVVIETSGYANKDKFEKILKYCDCFYYDCKADSEFHEECTGVSDKIIMDNLDYLLNSGATVVLRCPIVPGANLTDDYINKIITVGKKHPSLVGISLLPYHKYGVEKNKNIGKEKQDIYVEPDNALMGELKAKIRDAINVKVW